MRKFIRLLAMAMVASMPLEAGVSISVHAGGGFCGTGFRGGGSCSGYRSFYGGRGYGFYGGGYGYGYASNYGYASYPIGYDSASYYGGSVYPSAYPPTETAPTQPSTQAANPSATPSGPLPTGKVDEFGVIHSPYSTTTFKAANIANGQVFYDPTTGQPFMVHVTAPATAPAPGAPSATSGPAGKLDEFGYIHSPFSTFTFKVQNGNYAQTFRDPFTSQDFTVSAPPPTATVASVRVSH